MKETKIQWCHSTINPVMGCDGCELWPRPAQVVRELQESLCRKMGLPPQHVREVLGSGVNCGAMSEVYRERKLIADKIQAAFETTSGVREEVLNSIRAAAKCYAGHLATVRAGHKGYAAQFEQPKLFPGRMAMAAKWPPPTLGETTTKPWLEGCPRLIFISDMGDALSQEVPFSFLRQEIIENVKSAAGQRHIWLWLTKRPAQMAEFGSWLMAQGVSWPGNLMALTTITAQANAGRLDQLRKVPSRWKGLSLEPLFGPLQLCLEGIDWVIVGGGSDVLAEPFHIDWAWRIREQCKSTATPFFLKQLGKHAFSQGQSLDLVDGHGGDWSEWQSEWRVREIPQAFRDYSTGCQVGRGGKARGEA